MSVSYSLGQCGKKFTMWFKDIGMEFVATLHKDVTVSQA